MQTVWWLLSMAVLIVFIFLPFRELSVNGTLTLQTPLEFPMLLGLILTAAFATFVVVLLFKNRPLQIKIGRILLLLHSAIYSLLLYMYWHYSGEQQKLLLTIIVPAISFFFQTLALRAVKKDEALIKSMDRLR